MAERTLRVLDVGQCDMDHGTIAGLLRREFGAELDRAHTPHEALEALSREPYDLVLVNRIFDRDGAQGLELIGRIKACEAMRNARVMLVSNYAEAQDAAVAAGAVRGFGKAAVDTPATVERLAEVLNGTAPSVASKGPGAPG